MINIYEELLNLSKRGEEGVLVTVIEKEGSGPLPPGAKMLVFADGRSAGTVGGGTLERLAVEKAAAVLKEKTALLQRYALIDQQNVTEEEEATDMVCGGKVTLFFEYLTSGPHLYLLGGGHVGQALAYHLHRLPYYVTVIDHRPGIEDAVGNVDRVIIAEYEDALSDEAIPEGSYFIIATPAHEADYRVLRKIVASDLNPRYVGLLASRSKIAKFIRDLKEELGSDADLSALFTPTGLDIGGSSADEIAISVIAEIQAVRYDRDSKHQAIPFLRQAFN